MACLVQNSASTVAHLPVHENLSKKRKLSQSNGFKKQRIHDASSPSSWSPLYGGHPRLDQDTIQYIHKFYCKDCQMDQQAAERAKAAAAAGGSGDSNMAEDGASDIKQEPLPPISPQQTTDEASLAHGMDKNKESLKRKLMMRRSLHELVDQGIYPPPKTPPAFMEQRKSLERAKTGDLLRYKIQHRPDRQLLVQQHILEDTNIDPSLHERQRLLKRARLTDNLNDKLSHRPGVLELVQSNILQTDDKLKELIKEGSLSFDKTCEGEDFSAPTQFTFDDSKSSDGSPSPDQTDDSNMSDISSPLPTVPELPASSTKSHPFATHIQFSQASKVTLPLSTQPFSISQTSNNVSVFTGSSGSSLSPKNGSQSSTNSINNNNNKSRPKKPKPKTQPKAKVIKFHEYKGPPNIVKTQVVPQGAVNPNSDTPYHILLQQQQLFLQWQLEFNQKNMNLPLLLPAQKGESTAAPVVQTVPVSSATPPITGAGIGGVIATSTVESAPISTTSQTSPQTVFTMTSPQSLTQPQIKQIQITTSSAQVKQEPVRTQTPPVVAQPQPQIAQPQPSTVKPAVKKQPPSSSPAAPKQFSNLEEMKVAELKAELKKRNLPVSGPKPQLIERLKPYADVIIKPSSDKSQTSTSSAASSAKSPTSVAFSSVGHTGPSQVTIKSTSASVTSPGSVMSLNSVMSPPGSVMSVNGSVMSPPGMVFSNVVSSPASNTGGSQAVSVLSSGASLLSQAGTLQSVASPLGSVYSTSSVTSPQGSNTSQPGSVFSRTGSVMSPLGSVIDETLSTNAVSPLPSIQSMQSAVSVTNMMPDDINCVFSPPSSPSFIDSVMNPLSPDIMDLHIASPPDLSASQNKHQQNASQSSIPVAMEQSRPPSVAPSEPGKVDTAPMDVDEQLSQSLNLTSTPPVNSQQMLTSAQITSSLAAQQQQLQQQQQQLLQQIQQQLMQQQLQLQQQQQQQQQNPSDQIQNQISQEIETLESQIEESQRRLQLQQLQHQQLQQQQQQLQKLQQLQQQHLQQQQQQQQIISPPAPISTPKPQVQPQPQLVSQQVPQQVSQQPHSQPAPSVQAHTQPTLSIQNPKSPPQVIISVPNIPNGGKTPPLPVTLQPNAKQIQIPANLLQNSQGLHTVIVTQNPNPKGTDQNKAVINDFLKNQAVNQAINLGNLGKSLITVSTTQAGLQQFIITSTAAKSSPNTSVNGLTQTRATSLPGSPVDNQRSTVTRTASNPNPFFMKDPPKYDEVVKNRQHQQKTSPTIRDGNTVPALPVKSQTMDDVLEILIRTGELPASAAHEPPPTPKTTTQTAAVPTMSMAQTVKISGPEKLTSSIGTMMFPQTISSLAQAGSSTTTSTTSVSQKAPEIQMLQTQNTGVGNQLVKTEPLSPPNSVFVSLPQVSESNSNDFFDISDAMIANDLNSMDWMSDSAFGNLDLTDTTNMGTDIDMKLPPHTENSLLSIPMASSPHKSSHGSEPDLAVLGLGDGDTGSNMQIDVPDWLDVIMPSTGLTPLSANAPESFPLDPTLTPKTQQEVLDLFNFDESDLNTPSEFTCVTNWDKLTETKTS